MSLARQGALEDELLELLGGGEPLSGPGFDADEPVDTEPEPEMLPPLPAGSDAELLDEERLESIEGLLPVAPLLL